MQPYQILSRKRAGEALDEAEIRAVSDGAAHGSWSDAQLGAFLMASAIQGLDPQETAALTRAMLESGEEWCLRDDIPLLCDKHSTGGVGDKISLVLAPVLATLGLPVAMLTGRALGHTAGTADKLETIPGLGLGLDRRRCVELLREVGMAIGVATESIAPADRRLYALRDQTATVDSLPLITASIISKKAALGPAALVFDVKTGDGAFMSDCDLARQLAELLVRTAGELGVAASAWITDMSQPLGDWVGQQAEVWEALECLAGRGAREVVEVTRVLAEELGVLLGRQLRPGEVEQTLASGRARQRFLTWARAQGAEPEWLDEPRLVLAPCEQVIAASRDGFVAEVKTRRLGLLMAEAARFGPGRPDPGVAFLYRCRIGARLEAGEELGRLYLRRADEALVSRVESCFRLADAPVEAPPLLRLRVAG